VVVDDFHQLPSSVKDAHTVSESGVGCSGENEVRETKLLHPTESLECTRLHHPPHDILEFVSLKFDQVMERVSDAL
jgi:hypothetical protein